MPHPASLSPEFIPLKDVLRRMQDGERFDISYVKADVKRGTGGQIKTLLGCMLMRKTGNASKQHAGEPTPEQLRKNPHHFANSTRNIQHLKTGEKFKIHIRLLLTYNGKKVL